MTETLNGGGEYRGRALIAMSGGVDSSVAAACMMRDGYDCIGMTMHLYDNETAGTDGRTCCSLSDVEDAKRVCESLGIDERDLTARVGRVFTDLVQQESNARIRLVDELPRVFEDAISRSIAILRSCRLLSEWELLDIISPLRIAAELDFLDHFSREEALALTRSRLAMSDGQAPATCEEQRERDRRDAALADKVNRRFKSVRLNARGKDYLS